MKSHQILFASIYCMFQVAAWAQSSGSAVKVEHLTIESSLGLNHFNLHHKVFGEVDISKSRVCLSDSKKIAYDILVLDDDSILYGLVSKKEREELANCDESRLPIQEYGWLGITGEFKSQLLLTSLQLYSKSGQSFSKDAQEIEGLKRLGEAFKVNFSNGDQVVAFILNHELEFAGKFEKTRIPLSFISSYTMPKSFRAKATAESKMQYEDLIASFFLDIPAGSFQMGLHEDLSLTGDEAPAHKVIIPRSFQVDINEFSCDAWNVVSGALEWSEFIECKIEQDRGVLTNVSYHQVQEILEILNNVQEKWTYRLPTESEWEYIAHLHGRNPILVNKAQDSNPVAVEYLNQLFGGVWEMTGSTLQPYSSIERIDIPEKSVISRVVYRGGSDRSLPKTRNRFYRGALSVGKSSHDLGFRLIRERRK